MKFIIFLSVFFYVHSRFIGQQGKADLFLSPACSFPPFHRYLDISRVITAESSPLRIANSRIRTGNVWFTSASC